MKPGPRISAAGCTFISILGTAAHAEPKVIADILPVHSIVSRIMDGIGQPALLMRPGSSPHDYSLQPSDGQRLQSADVVFWVGPELTPWLAEPLHSIADGAQTVALIDLPTIDLLESRDVHHHQNKHDHDHDHDEPDDHLDDDENARLGTDPHIWLSPENAASIGHSVADTLGALDPENETAYRSNASEFDQEMVNLTTIIDETLGDSTELRFLVYHDAFQYFENSFGLYSAGSLAAGDAATPGAGSVRRVRELAVDGQIDCVLMEPQLPSKLTNAIVSQTGVGVGVLDPLGADLEPGPELYAEMMSTIAQGIADCRSSG